MNDRQKCPHCKGFRVRKSGKSYLASGVAVQRWYCNGCHKTFQPVGIDLSNRPPCPTCQGASVLKYGLYSLSNGTAIQRWFCQRCDKAFRQPLTDSSPVSCGLEEK